MAMRCFPNYRINRFNRKDEYLLAFAKAENVIQNAFFYYLTRF